MIFSRMALAVATPLSASILCLGIVGATPAAAQDNPWSGFYVGANAGVTWSDSQLDATIATTGTPPANVVVPPADITAINATTHFNSKHHTGFTGGIEAGYNYVMDSGFLLGIETDINIYDITGSHSNTVQSRTLINPPTTYTVSQSVDTDFIWNLRPRIGYAMDKFLIFASGGLAVTSTQYKATFVDSRAPGNTVELKSNDNGKTGWTIGGGAAYAFTPSLSLKGEYLFTDFGHSDFTTTSTNGFLTFNADAHLKSHMFRAGLDYRF